jgi:hypothetical protein
MEDRLCPAITIQLDYSFDTQNFFANAAAKTAMESVASEVGARLDDQLSAISPNAANNYSATFTSPGTGQTASVDNLAVPANTIIVFVGATTLPNGVAGIGGPGGFSNLSGTPSFESAVISRGQSPQPADFAAWGGALSFDIANDWYFDLDPNVPSSKTDFISVARHELFHVLGFGTSDTFQSKVSGSSFAGANAVAVFGGPVPVDNPGNAGHWEDGTLDKGQPTVMDPVLNPGRAEITDLDYAGLKDIGWQVNTGGSSPTVPGVPPTVPPTVPNVPPTAPVGNLSLITVAGSGAGVRTYTANGGFLQPYGTPFVAFPGVPGSVHGTTGDFNGDGQDDTVYFQTGGGDRVRIRTGQTNIDMISGGIARAFAGEDFSRIGINAAAGDVNGDGIDELVVAPDQGGGARIQVFSLDAGRLVQRANFFGIDDAAFRGGARIAMGDVNGDGFSDLIVAAGVGGGPRVAIYDGKDLFAGNRAPRKLVGDFLAFDSGLRDGVNVATGDINGDGKADVVFGGGPGGAPRVLALDALTVLSGIDIRRATPLANFFAFAPTERGGAVVATKDLDGDKRADLIVANGSATNPGIRTFLSTSLPAAGQGTPAVQQSIQPINDSILVGSVFVG